MHKQLLMFVYPFLKHIESKVANISRALNCMVRHVEVDFKENGTNDQKVAWKYYLCYREKLQNRLELSCLK